MITDKFSARLAIGTRTGTQKEVLLTAVPGSKGVRGTLNGLLG